MFVSFWPTQPCIAVMPDSRCAKDTSTATEHAQNARQRARGSSINKEDVPNGFQIIRESLKVLGNFKGSGNIILQFKRCGTLKQ